MGTMIGVPPPNPSEQLIGALIPASLPRPRPPQLPAIELPPVRVLGTADDLIVLSADQLDRSGRIPAAAAVAALGWSAGTILRAEVRTRRIVLRTAPRGPATAAVTARAQITVPVAVRRTCGIDDGATVVLAALIAQQLLVIHPASEVVRLLRRTHARILGGRHDG